MTVMTQFDDSKAVVNISP